MKNNKRKIGVNLRLSLWIDIFFSVAEQKFIIE
jgi:hypothetical protein